MVVNAAISDCLVFTWFTLACFQLIEYSHINITDNVNKTKTSDILR